MSNTFRKQYRELSDAEKFHVELIKAAAEGLEKLVLEIPVRRDEIGTQTFRQVQALTNLEQAVMWAVKAAT